MKMRVFLFLAFLAMMAILLGGCGSIPTLSGEKLSNVNPAPMEPGQMVTVIDIETNSAAAQAEPYPVQLALVSNAKGEYLKPKTGGEYRAVGISFQDGSGAVAEPVSGGRISAPAGTLAGLQPFYGGPKRIVIDRPLAELVSGGWKLTASTNDSSQAKHVFGLDGRGLHGEPYGTPWRQFDPAKDGVPILLNNPRIREMRTDSPEFQLWTRELILKAAIVAFGQDAEVFSADERLREFQGFALNPFEKRYVERQSSKLHRFWQVMTQLELIPVATDSFASFGLGIGVTKGMQGLYTLLSDPQFFPAGSAGSPVLRWDWAVGQQQVGRQDLAYGRNKEYNRLVDVYSELVNRYNFEDDDAQAAKLLVEIKAVWAKMKALAEPTSAHAAEKGPAVAPETARPTPSASGPSGEGLEQFLDRTAQ